VTKNTEPVRQLGAEEVPDVVDVICESFFDYPIMRFVLGESNDYDRRLRALIRFFVMARILRREVLLGIGDPGKLSGAALVSYPERSESPAELAQLRDEVWTELGDSSRQRYEAFGVACATFDLDVPHIHLNMLGVRRKSQGTGGGRRLIDHVHVMSREDPASTGVTLTTEDEANVALYEHLGYEIVGQAVIVPGLKTWGFFRRDE